MLAVRSDRARRCRRIGLCRDPSRSQRRLQDIDTTVLLWFMMTPLVGVRGPAHLHRVESEGCRVGSVWVGLHDVSSEDAEHDAVVGPRADPAQGADGAPRTGVWKRARGFVAYGTRSLAVYLAVLHVVLKVL